MDIIKINHQIKKETANDKNRGNFLNDIIKYSTYLLTFLLPLFFFPWTYEKIEYAKQILLWGLSGIAFIAWIARMIIEDREIKIKKDLLSIAVAVFLFINFLVLIFSRGFYYSLWGYFGRYSDSFLGLISFVAIYFVIVNNRGLYADSDAEKTRKETSASNPRKYPRLIRVLLSGAFIAEVILILSAYGIVQKIAPWIPGNLLSSFSGGAAMFIVVVLCIVISRFIISTVFVNNRDYKRFFSILFIIASLYSLVILNFKPSWIVLIVSMIILAATELYKRFRGSEIKLSGVAIPIIAAVIAGLFLFGAASESIIGLKPVFDEARLSAKESLLIAGRSLRQDPLLGSGQGNFLYNFSKFKSLDFAKNSIYRELRFNKAGNYISELIAITGLLGIASFLFLVTSPLVPLLIRRGESSESSLFLSRRGVRGEVFLIICFSFFFYSSTTLLLFVFWLLISLIGMENTGGGYAVLSLEKFYDRFEEFSLAANVFVGIIAMLFVVFAIKVMNKYRANSIYTQINADEKADERRSEAGLLQYEPELLKARNLDKKDPLYPMALTRIYLAEVKDEIKNPPSEQSVSRVKDLTEKVIGGAVLATELASDSISAWELRASVYRDVYPVVGDAEKAMLEAFKKSAELEPTNPIILTELGKAYALNNENENARKEFEKALEIRPGCEDAKLQLALVKEKFGSAAEAKQDLEIIAQERPNDAEIKFELGKIQFNSGDIDSAIASFQDAIKIFPKYSNAIYSLALCYVRKENKEEALKLFNKVLELNPGNKDVLTKIEELED